MQHHKGQRKGDDHAELINGHYLGRCTHLQSVVVAQPACAGGKAGQHQKQPAATGSCAASPLARVVLPLPQRPSSASTSGRVGFCASAALSSADRVDAVMGVGMGVNLLGKGAPQGADPRIFPLYHDCRRKGSAGVVCYK